MTNIAIPNTFVAGNFAIAADVNENFTEIETFLNSTGVPLLQAGAVSAASKIADAIITPAKLALPGVAVVNPTAGGGVVLTTSNQDLVSGASVTFSGNSSYATADAAAGKVTAVATGIYLLFGRTGVSASSSTNSDVQVSLKKNGATGLGYVLRVPSVTVSSGYQTYFCHFVSATAGDYFTLYGKNVTGASVVTAVSDMLGIAYLGPSS